MTIIGCISAVIFLILIPFYCIEIIGIKMLILLPIIFFYFTVVGRAIFEVFLCVCNKYKK